MSKEPFFYRIDAKDIGAEVFSRSDEELLLWVKQFAISLMSNKPSCEYSKKIIEEAQLYKEKKRNAAKKRWENSKADALHKHSTSTANAHPMPETETETETELKNNILSDFEVWWDQYGKKTGKAKTLQKWEKLKPEFREKCLSVVSDYVKSTPDPTYRKNPLTYLNGQNWEDEIILNDNKGAPRQNGKPLSRMEQFRANMESVEVID